MATKRPKQPTRSTTPAGADYVWEKMLNAVGSMCGRGSLEERLADATVSALDRLEDHDLSAGALRRDLKYVLDWTKRNTDGGRVKKLPDDVELSKLIDKMLHILMQTHHED
jgi:hypothetical protein